MKETKWFDLVDSGSLGMCSVWRYIVTESQCCYVEMHNGY